MIWMRTCQKCGNRQPDTKPDIYRELPDPDTYRNRKCRRCGSIAMDYGKEETKNELP